ncbi:hypothetical protein [Nocardioides sp. AE5]|uniref:hypothetical protein n=1 Tax=Nocardioides sp. AE5 TaxID=2962573 RepID=UPI0028815B8F|nr:hypothetical protein [Nocardioides sp. AE5]MDT0202069.1 hypothetical protein [Nocardioides sp. AE5]
MRELGRKYLVVTGAGGAAAAVTALAAILQWWSVALAALSVAIVCTLGALALIRTDIGRMRSTLGRVPATSGTVTARHSAAGEVQLARRVAAEVQAALGATTTGSPRDDTTGTDQVAALLWIHTHHPAPTAPPLVLPGIMPAQFAAVLRLVKEQRPARVLAIDPGPAGAWLANAVAGETTLVMDAAAPYTSIDGARVVPVPRALPDVPHAWLEWYDLSDLAHSGPFDLIVVGVPDTSSAQATRPVLPLLDALLTPGGILTALEADPARPVTRAWAATPGWRADEADPALPLHHDA